MTAGPNPNEHAETISGAEAQRVARNAGAIAVARILSSGLLFGWQLLLAPWLGVSDYGIYGTVGALFAVGVPLASFSMGMIVIRDVARDPKRAGHYLSATLMLQTGLALLAYVGINIGALLLGYSETIRAFTALAGLSLFIDLTGNLSYDQLIARERMVATAVVEVAHVLVRIALAGGLLVLGYGLLGVYAATIVTGFGRSLVLWLALRRLGVRPVFPLDRPLTRLLLVNSAPLALSAFLSLAYQHADKLMTTALLGATGTGYLTAAFVIIYGTIEVLNTTVLIATYPMMSRVYRPDGDNAMFGMIVGKLAFFTLLLTLALSLTLTVFAADITLPLFGSDFRPTADVLRILIWYALVTMVANVYAQGMMVINQQRRLLVVRGGGLLTNICLNIVLLPRLGVTGAALASVLAECLVLVLLAWHMRRYAPQNRNITRQWRLLVVALGTAAVMVLAARLHPVIGIVGGLVFYSGGVIVLRVLSADDWGLLTRLVALIPGGSWALSRLGVAASSDAT